MKTEATGRLASTEPRASSGTYHPLVELTLARLREFLREPEAIFWTFFFPIVMSVMMAIAFPAGAARPVRVAVERSSAAIEPSSATGARDTLKASLTAERHIVVRDIPPGDELRALRNGEVDLIVVASHPPTYRFDPTRDESRLARLVVDEALKRATGRPDPWQANDETIAIPGSRYVDWLLPGIIALGVMNNGLWSIAFVTVQARLKKLLKRLAASPMRKRDFLMAPIVARLVFLAPEVGIPLAFGALVLGTPIRGGLASLGIVAVLGALAFGSLGLLIASRVRTFEAINGLMNLATVPMWVLSGVFFSATNFPGWAQPVIQALPLTALVDAMRGVVLEGATLVDLRGELATLATWAVVPFAIALRIFRWR